MGLSHMAQGHVITGSRGQALLILALVNQPCVYFFHNLGLLEEFNYIYR